MNFEKTGAFLIDTTKCTGCRGCQVACKQWNQLDAEKTTFFNGEGYQNPPLMSEHTFTRIKFRDYQKNGIEARGSVTVNVSGSTMGPPRDLDGLIAQNGLVYVGGASGSP